MKTNKIKINLRVVISKLVLSIMQVIVPCFSPFSCTIQILCDSKSSCKKINKTWKIDNSTGNHWPSFAWPWPCWRGRRHLAECPPSDRALHLQQFWKIKFKCKQNNKIKPQFIIVFLEKLKQFVELWCEQLLELWSIELHRGRHSSWRQTNQKLMINLKQIVF